MLQYCQDNWMQNVLMYFERIVLPCALIKKKHKRCMEAETSVERLQIICAMVTFGCVK